MQVVGWLLLLVVNLLFVCKYFSRAGLSPVWSCVGYTAGVVIFLVIWFVWVQKRISDKVIHWLFWILLVSMTLAIGLALWKVDPLSVRVDRWSATTYFLDALFQGIYPYGVHTHVSETNFPSPFPVWHYLNIPFWLAGDVGLGLIVMLWITMVGLYCYTRNIRVVFTVLLLLALSPAYWWEVLVRSDGLSNALLVFVVILWLEDRVCANREDLGEKWVLVAIDANTGRVFVGTGSGLMSYQSDAADPEESFSATQTYAYPNPVRPDYDGVITIRGLMEETIVKIVDNSGNLVCETRSNGGLAIWDGKNGNGQRVSSGVYSAFCNSSDGENHTVVKILIIH